MLEKLQLRAQVFAKVRQFFATRQVLEVETPLLYPSTIPTPYIHSFTTVHDFCGKQKILYLQTSPEFAMKRLLAQASGDIYQICKAFRNEEQGRLHNPEFTILEWYRVGYNHHQLMDEVDKFLQFILKTNKAERFSYQEIFQEYLQFDPFCASVMDLQKYAKSNDLNIETTENFDRDVWLQILLTHLIEPKLGKTAPVFIYGFPASQAALAQISKADPRICERFEVYLNGMELANGFHELTDVEEQRQRFVAELEVRKKLNFSQIPLDEDFLAALPNLPNCAGVALGIDRLLLIVAKAQALKDVMVYPLI